MTIFEHFNGVEIFFLICAIIGGIFVIIRLILQLVGVDHVDLPRRDRVHPLPIDVELQHLAHVWSS